VGATAPEDGEVVPLGEGQGVLEALALGVAEGEVEAVALAVGDALALPDGETVGVALLIAEGVHGVEAWASSVWLPGGLVVVPPRSRSAAGTTSKPRMTVITKASAPHSRSQKPRDELRIRARRPARAAAYCAY
jgi:hypothetical protein